MVLTNGHAFLTSSGSGTRSETKTSAETTTAAELAVVDSYMGDFADLLWVASNDGSGAAHRVEAGQQVDDELAFSEEEADGQVVKGGEEYFYDTEQYESYGAQFYIESGFSYTCHLVRYTESGFSYTYHLIGYTESGFSYTCHLIGYTESGFSYSLLRILFLTDSCA
eukprot:gene19525-26201_t